MKKYFVMGEDMPKKEISKEEAKNFLFDSDYHVIVEGEENEDVENVKSSFSEKPSWKPFEFPDRPGYRVKSVKLQMFDAFEFRGFKEVSVIPQEAVKTEIPNRWKLLDKFYQAVPEWELIPTSGYGDCSVCCRYQCPRRSNGIKCRNFKTV